MDRNQSNGKDTLLVGCILCSPISNKRLTAASTKTVIDAIKQTMDRKTLHILVGGNFNY